MRPWPLLFLIALGSGEAWAANPEQFHLRLHQLTPTEFNEKDLDAELRFGRDIAARVLGRLPMAARDARHRYVNLVGRSLARLANRPEIEFRFAIVKSAAITAYSTPGGYIFITTGALKAMQDEAELAAVLAHEIAHVTEKHIVKAFNIRGREDSALAGITRLVGGAQDSGRVAFSQAVNKAVKLLFETGYRHQDEIEADQMALLLLASSGYDTGALRRFLLRARALSRRHGDQSTHPPTRLRLAAMERFTREEGLESLPGSRAASRFHAHLRRHGPP